MKIAIGCCGFPVARDRYFGRFSAVEIESTFRQQPRPATAERWAHEAPAGFTYALRAPALITHSSTSAVYQRLRPKPDARTVLRYGHFKGTEEVERAWRAFERTADLVKPKFLVFQTPTTFYPNADHLRDMYRFFKKIRRNKTALVWELRGAGWQERTIARVCGDLGLIDGVDPFIRPPLAGAVRFYRLIGRVDKRTIMRGHVYSETELAHLHKLCDGKPTYVFFNNHSMWSDAERFLKRADPVTAALAAAARRRPRRRF